ncbi:zinc finger MYND domain-containing protein [Phanerochaete sordida]|uniref:Zinc finger MYND domain-containing protein n=1 Tax=Phanerochaete sordida TaxID=48140 RepID=A0A9P3GHS4_9APHY|nr:zinc finger MYND domain-containing protein [Phanerochaete sordida]
MMTYCSKECQVACWPLHKAMCVHTRNHFDARANGADKDPEFAARKIKVKREFVKWHNRWSVMLDNFSDACMDLANRADPRQYYLDHCMVVLVTPNPEGSHGHNAFKMWDSSIWPSSEARNALPPNLPQDHAEGWSPSVAVFVHEGASTDTRVLAGHVLTVSVDEKTRRATSAAALPPLVTHAAAATWSQWLMQLLNTCRPERFSGGTGSVASADFAALFRRVQATRAASVQFASVLRWPRNLGDPRGEDGLRQAWLAEIDALRPGKGVLVPTVCAAHLATNWKAMARYVMLYLARHPEQDGLLFLSAIFMRPMMRVRGLWNEEFVAIAGAEHFDPLRLPHYDEFFGILDGVDGPLQVQS